MIVQPDFAFKPLPPLEIPVHFPFPSFPGPLGPLADLAGTWEGTGFNTIWRPFHGASDHFLELNLTTETLEFTPINGPIPNRGLLQQDINMFGLTYLQQIQDANVGAGLHIEPGIWATVPPTTNPGVPSTVVRMASIPHGTALLAQGVARLAPGSPGIPNNNIIPFPIGTSGPGLPFPEQNLSQPSAFRSAGNQVNGITQAMVDNPNSVLQSAIAGQTIISSIVLEITTLSSPVQGGGTANTAFLKPNANASQMTATFWIERVKGQNGGPDFTQLQYTQTVNLDFATLTWPHVTVATLRKKPIIPVNVQRIDPAIPEQLLREIEAARG